MIAYDQRHLSPFLSKAKNSVLLISGKDADPSHRLAGKYQAEPLCSAAAEAGFPWYGLLCNIRSFCLGNRCVFHDEMILGKCSDGGASIDCMSRAAVWLCPRSRLCMLCIGLIRIALLSHSAVLVKDIV